MKRFVLLVLLLAVCIYGKAQSPQVYFDRLDIQKGLPESYVRNIIEDTDGYIWIATQNGLVRYDGYNYKVYNLGSKKLNLTSVTNVFGLVNDEARKTFWVSVGGNGLFRYNRAMDTFDQFPNQSKTIFQFFMAKKVDQEGNVWGFINDQDVKKLARFNVKTKRFDFYSKLEKGDRYIAATQLYNIKVGPTGTIWMASNNGAYGFNGDRKPTVRLLFNADTTKSISAAPVYEAPSQPGYLWANLYESNNRNLRVACINVKTGKTVKEYRQSNKADSLADAYINSIYEDKKKRLWLSTKTGLFKLDRATNKFTRYLAPDTVYQAFNNIEETKDGKFWVSIKGGLARFDPETGIYQFFKSTVDTNGSLAGRDITQLMTDRTNTLWISFAYAGVSKLSKVKSAYEFLQPFGNPGDKANELIYTSPTLNGSARVATRGGIYNWRTGSGKFNKFYTAAPGQYINDVAEDSGMLFIGTKDGFITYNINTGGRQVYRNNPNDSTSIPATSVNKVFKDHDGIVWLGMGNEMGICSFNPATKKFTRYPFHINYDKLFNVNDGALDDGRVVVIYEDRQNTLWVGTNAGSLNKFDRKTGKFFSYFNKRNEQMSCISAIHEDRNGRFWVGTYLTGFFEFDRKKGVFTRQINEKSGLLFNSVSVINEDSAGRIWIGTDRGMSRLDPKTMKLRNFRTGDMLPGKEFANIQTRGMIDGKFVLSLKDGLAVFNPGDLDDDANAPIVHIENIRYNNPGANDSLATQVIAAGYQLLELAHNQNSVTFNYVGLHYEDPANNTYAYMLEGYDKQWVQAGTNRTVTYTNLPPGTYTFKVKAANSSGVWNDTGDSIKITVNAPWWVRWWAWVLYVLALGAVIYYYIDYRSRQLQIENQLLEEKVDERTNELQVANTELSEHQEEIKAQRDQLANTLSELKTTQQQLIQSEKLASLGELTAGIAHEIQNPLNFVNNFSEVSIELAVEMKQELRSGSKKEAVALADDIVLNLEKIIHHGKRADGIVKNMLQHSRANSGDKQPVDLNALVDEYFRLSYHGLRAKDKDFNSEMIADFDPELPKVMLIPQDMGRVLLNLFNNAFYAIQQKRKTAGKGYKPVVEVSTSMFRPPNGKPEVRIYIKDNGNGIPDALKDKIMQPFFTTKPTGEGTGLGLSLSYDIVVKGHNGKMDMSSKEGEYTEFIVQLPAS